MAGMVIVAETRVIGHTHTHTQMVARGKKEKKGSNTIEVEETFQVYVNTIMEVP